VRHLFLFLLLGQDQPTLHSEVTLVHVDVEVREDNRSITGLSKDNFRVTDNGNLQTIVYLARQEAPLDVILLLDARAEMRSVLERVAGAAKSALSELRQGDRIAVIAFGSAGGKCRTDPISDFTADFEGAGQSIGNQALHREFGPGDNGCQPIGGLEGAAQAFLRRPSETRRRAIVIVTGDKGCPTAPQGVRRALHDLWSSDAVVLGVIVPGRTTCFGIGPPYRGARYAAGKTGGDTLETTDAADGLHEMILRLRQRYSLYYALPPSKPNEDHKIGVQLTSAAARRYPHAIVRARTGYAMPSARQ
jgi:VWFA-related protein